MLCGVLVLVQVGLDQEALAEAPQRPGNVLVRALHDGGGLLAKVAKDDDGRLDRVLVAALERRPEIVGRRLELLELHRRVGELGVARLARFLQNENQKENQKRSIMRLF